MRHMTPEEHEHYMNLIKDAKQIQWELDEFLNAPQTYGYARVSSRSQASDGNSLEAQKRLLVDSGAPEDAIYADVYTGTTTERPELDKLLQVLKSGDTLIIAKLDRISRSVQQGISLLEELAAKGVTVKVLNMGTIDNSPEGKLLRNMLLCFAEFEREMIMQRTREGKEIAKTKPGYREGRKPKYTQSQLQHAILLLQDHSYTQVEALTGISKSTLIRAKKQMKETEEKE